MQIAEFTGIAEIDSIAAFLGEHSAVGAAVLDYYGGDMNEARAATEDRYLGAHASLADYVQEVTEETTVISTALQH